MRTNNKCTEVGPSHEGSHRPKTTVAKGTKGNSSTLPQARKNEASKTNIGSYG
ncbi:hypothetical protein Prudu_018757 [Prunus dulcis]|uniref:Uncharacterized protein n=1 Tax=Prunus dulcis TaxID=3755 RepID=A0A4Y1RRJ0_PRUDU|nr:hypothetical protein Prudu_018757 [Prunus dulcis]